MGLIFISTKIFGDFPLKALLRDKLPWVWGALQATGFDLLKRPSGLHVSRACRLVIGEPPFYICLFFPATPFGFVPREGRVVVLS